VLVHPRLVNRAPALWGADAPEWRPARWMDGAAAALPQIPGVWGNTLSFLGGPRACIGFRFALNEYAAARSLCTGTC
jgi:cytochrome P450